jgi:hypothetical protein
LVFGVSGHISHEPGMNPNSLPYERSSAAGKKPINSS